MRLTPRRVRTTCAALLLVAGLFVALGTSPPAAVAASDCPDLPNLTPNEWRGAADGLWRSDDNWSLGYAPGYVDGATGYACILSGSARLDGPDDIRKVTALYVGPDAGLVVTGGSQLFVRGDPDKVLSRVDGTMTLSGGAAFGGEGRVKLGGTLVWHSEPDGPMATLATRGCALAPPAGETPATTAQAPRIGRFEACDGADDGHLDGPGGLLVVKSGGEVLVDGSGVAQIDSYRVRVYGTVSVTGGGYVVADRGTTTELRGSGKYLFDNDGGYYEGASRFGEDRLSAFVNEGTLEKTGGDGVSAVNASYTQAEGDGEIKIDQGTLRVASGTPVAARVGPGASYGSGECRRVGGTFGCRPRTDADDPQNAMMRIPKIDGDGAEVVVSELSESDPIGIGVPVEVHAEDLDATKRHPAILSFRLDDALLETWQTWRYVRVFRDSGAPGDYRRVRPCDGDGRPPEGQQACVDRRNIAGVSSRNKDGDVIMVVRAVGTSRWICR